MNKLLTMLLLFIAVPLFSQAVNWGDEFQFGMAFTKTDSLKLRTTVTEVDTSDTVYTAKLDMDGDVLEGIWTIKFYADSSDAASDSIDLDVRFFYKSEGDRKWGPWNKVINNARSDSLYILNIAQSDSSWFGPANGRQFRIYRQDTAKDTLDLPRLSDYMR